MIDFYDLPKPKWPEDKAAHKYRPTQRMLDGFWETHTHYHAPEMSQFARAVKRAMESK